MAPFQRRETSVHSGSHTAQIIPISQRIKRILLHIYSVSIMSHYISHDGTKDTDTDKQQHKEIEK